MPKPVPSSVRPIAVVKSALPSANINKCSALDALPHASTTKTSFTDIQATVSTPLALISSTCTTNPGRCETEQVGVNAPGTANNTTFLPSKISEVLIPAGPSAPIIVNIPAGILSPTLIVITTSNKHD